MRFTPANFLWLLIHLQTGHWPPIIPLAAVGAYQPLTGEKKRKQQMHFVDAFCANQHHQPSPIQWIFVFKQNDSNQSLQPLLLLLLQLNREVRNESNISFHRRHRRLACASRTLLLVCTGQTTYTFCSRLLLRPGLNSIANGNLIDNNYFAQPPKRIGGSVVLVWIAAAMLFHRKREPCANL